MPIRKQEKLTVFRMHHFSLLDANEQNGVSFLGDKRFDMSNKYASIDIYIQ